MRKIRALFVVLLLLALTVGTACAEKDTTVRRTVQYPGREDITIAVPAQYKTFYRDNTGLSINLAHKEKSSYARVKILPYDPNFNEKEYIDNEWTPYIRSLYVFGKNNYLAREGKVQKFTVGGREMTGCTYTTTLVGYDSTNWILLDRFNGDIFRYEIYFPDDDPDDTLLLLSNMVRSVTGSVMALKAKTGNLAKIDCAEQKFSFSANPQYPWKYDAQSGVTVYTKKEGVIPYIMVYQSNDLIVEAYEYIKEQYTPYMQNQYGDNLTYSYEFQDYVIGGKTLPVGYYEYKVGDRTVTALRFYDSTGNRTVAYTAKFVKGEGDNTMAALDAAVRTFHSDAKPIR